jgi:Ca2+-transporting ATPase
VQNDQHTTIFASGAPESIFKIAAHVSEATHMTLHDFLHKGLRTIGLAIYQTPKTETIDVKKIIDKAKGHFTFLGITGIEDELRPEVQNVIAHTRKAGIRVIMATGDHKTTAAHIAKTTGILLPNDDIITGTELPEHGDDYAKLNLETITVYARVTPHQKLMLVKALRNKGYHVAMTGDGINDIPSLAASDIGIAMGSGTDAAKEAADVILVDDSFTSIVKALEEGRHIFATLRRVIWYFFSTNLSELLIIFYAFALGLPTPLRAAQILWLNVVTDGFLDIALAMEPHEQETLSLQKKHTHLIDSSLMIKILIDSAVMTFGSLIIYHALYTTDLATTQTMMLVCMALFQWFNAWNCRSETQSIWQRGLTSNRLLIMMTMLVLLLQLLVVYVPEFQYLFKTVPLSLKQWGIIIMIASSIIIVEEIRKAVVRHIMHKKQTRL